jgi:hypothetical protein
MIKKKIKQISEQVKREVMKIREDLRARILAKQKDEKRKRQLVMNKITSLKKDISKDLLKASKNGNAEECNPDRPTNQILEYCKVNFEYDYSKMNECVENDNFCYMCCESEFGDLHLEARSNCHTKCDDFYIYKVKFKKQEGESENSDKNNKHSLNNKFNSAEKNINTNDKNMAIANKNIINDKLKNNIKNRQLPSLGTKVYFPNKKLVNNAKYPPQYSSKFLETNLVTDSSFKSELPSHSQDEYYKLIEEAKKKELLMDIKQDLNF